jgi:hypothetical protein
MRVYIYILYYYDIYIYIYNNIYACTYIHIIMIYIYAYTYYITMCIHTYYTHTHTHTHTHITLTATATSPGRARRALSRPLSARRHELLMRSVSRALLPVNRSFPRSLLTFAADLWSPPSLGAVPSLAILATIVQAGITTAKKRKKSVP